MYKLAFLFCVMLFTTSHAADVVDAEIAAVTDEINQPTKSDPPTMPVGEPLITINTDTLLDMNDHAALDVSGGMPHTEQIVLPFLQNYPINDLEIKLRVFDFKF